MRIAIDATPAAVQGAGVGRYTRELLRALVELDPGDDFELLCMASAERSRALLHALPPGNARTLRRLPVADRWSTLAWHRLRLPVPVDALLPPFDVFHGPDFVLPPSRRPRVVTIHDLSFRVAPQYSEPALAAYLNAAVPRSLRMADRIIAVSAAVAAEIDAAYPFTRGRVVAIPHGVRLPATQTVRAAADSAIVLFVGTVEPRKGLPTLLKAMKRVRGDIPSAHLVVAGRIGWRADDIVAAIRAAERDGFATFVEAPDDAALERLFANAAVCAYPSHYEGFGLPVLEALARGIPVITSDLPVLRETAGNAALFATIGDADAFADALLCVLGDRELRAALTERGHNHAAGYSWRRTALATRRVYTQAMNRDA